MGKTKMFIIMKSSRFELSKSNDIKYSPYNGPSCISADVEPGKVYDDLESAELDCLKLIKVNPVGFVVIQSND
jgi:hypothetical protein